MMDELIQYATKKYPKRFTVRNPDKKTYRMPMRESSIRIESDQYGATVYGDAINALGWWESWGMTAEEAERVFLAAGKKRSS